MPFWTYHTSFCTRRGDCTKQISFGLCQHLASMKRLCLLPVKTNSRPVLVTPLVCFQIFQCNPCPLCSLQLLAEDLRNPFFVGPTVAFKNCLQRICQSSSGSNLVHPPVPMTRLLAA